MQDADLAFTDLRTESRFCAWRSARLAAMDVVHCLLLLLAGAAVLLWQWYRGLHGQGSPACWAGGKAPSPLSMSAACKNNLPLGAREPWPVSTWVVMHHQAGLHRLGRAGSRVG